MILLQLLEKVGIRIGRSESNKQDVRQEKLKMFVSIIEIGEKTNENYGGEKIKQIALKISLSPL